MHCHIKNGKSVHIVSQYESPKKDSQKLFILVKALIVFKTFLLHTRVMCKNEEVLNLKQLHWSFLTKQSKEIIMLCESMPSNRPEFFQQHRDQTGFLSSSSLPFLQKSKKLWKIITQAKQILLLKK